MGMSVQVFGELAEWTWGCRPCLRRLLGDLRLLFWGTGDAAAASARGESANGARLLHIGAPKTFGRARRSSDRALSPRAVEVVPQKLSQLAARRAPGPQKLSQSFW